jgi:glucose/arabinose dehydrogenase
MKKLLILVPIILIALGVWGALSQRKVNSVAPGEVEELGAGSGENETVIAQNLDTPWGMTFLPDNSLLFTERQGLIKRISPDGVLPREPVATVRDAREAGEGGLLGIAAHPRYPEEPYVYVYYTYQSEGDNTLNRVSRFTYEDNQMTKEEVLIDRIAGASFHNGGILRFGPDNNLYVGTGDGQEPSRAQDTKNLAGKILRVTDGGQPVAGNPFQNEVFSYGHRNVQGLAWDNEGTLFATEHGRSGLQSGLDELNKIEAGKNYGWPEIEGSETAQNMVAPAQNSGNTTWAPAGLAFQNDRFYFGGLRGQSLYTSEYKNNIPQPIEALYAKKYGRIRAVVVGPNDALYFSTSNQDGRGNPGQGDDKIIRVTNPADAQ